MKQVRRRNDDEGRPKGALIFLWRHAKDITAFLVLCMLGFSGFSYFASAADVEKKFTAVKVEIKTVALEARRQRIEDELFRLRIGGRDKGTLAQIQRFESELRDVSARLRQLEERRP